MAKKLAFHLAVWVKGDQVFRVVGSDSRISESPSVREILSAQPEKVPWLYLQDVVTGDCTWLPEKEVKETMTSKGVQKVELPDLSVDEVDSLPQE